MDLVEKIYVAAGTHQPVCSLFGLKQWYAQPCFFDCYLLEFIEIIRLLKSPFM